MLLNSHGKNDLLPNSTLSKSLSCQRCKHVNSCDIVMIRESLPSAPIRAPVSPPAAPTWLHLPAIMNCQHRSLPHLYRPIPCFLLFGLALCIFSLHRYSHNETDIWMLNSINEHGLKTGFNLIFDVKANIKEPDSW